MPKENDKMYMFGYKTTKIITITDNTIKCDKIDTHDYDCYIHSDPILLENGELIILGQNHILLFDMKTNKNLTVKKKGW